MSLFKKKESAEQKTFIFPDSKIYYEYQVKVAEKILVFILGFIIGAAMGMVFYDLIPVAIIMGIGVGIAAVPIWKKTRINKQIETLKKQFKSLLESISTSIGAGRNMNDAFTGALVDLRELYSPDAYIVKEVENVLSGMNNNISIETMLRDLGERSGINDIITFADVFDTCYRKGGDMKQVIGSTYQIINDKMEIEMEINTMITSSKSELTMMCFMPVIFVFVLNSMGADITGRGTPSGYIATTIALVMFVGAYLLGRKIMSIKL